MKNILILLFLTVSLSESVSHNKVVYCYYGSWSYYRGYASHFEIDYIDPTLCTHGIYGYARLSTFTWNIVPRDPYLDLDPVQDCGDSEWSICGIGGYRKFTDLKNRNPDFKVIYISNLIESSLNVICIILAYFVTGRFSVRQ